MVTGASGFIGGRLEERLAFDEEAKVRAAVRSFRNAARVAPLSPEKVELRHFNMTAQNATEGAYESLVEGCDTVFHLARDARSRKANQEGVKRFEQIKNKSVYFTA